MAEFTKENPPAVVYNRESDGTTYFYINDALWSAPTFASGGADYENMVAVSDFDEPLFHKEIDEINAALAEAMKAAAAATKTKQSNLNKGHLDAAIKSAVACDDLDEACRFIQGALGVTDGGVAGMYFSGPQGDSWETLSRDDRLDAMRSYIASEVLWMGELVDRFRLVASNWRWDKDTEGEEVGIYDTLEQAHEAAEAVEAGDYDLPDDFKWSESGLSGASPTSDVTYIINKVTA